MLAENFRLAVASLSALPDVNIRETDDDFVRNMPGGSFRYAKHQFTTEMHTLTLFYSGLLTQKTQI